MNARHWLVGLVLGVGGMHVLAMPRLGDRGGLVPVAYAQAGGGDGREADGEPSSGEEQAAGPEGDEASAKGADSEAAEAAEEEAEAEADAASQPQGEEAAATEEAAAEGRATGQSSAEAPELVPRTLCEGKRIEGIGFAGNRRVTEEDMLATVRLRRAMTCRDAAVTADVRALWALGFFDDIAVDAKPKGRGVVLTFQVRERPAVGEVSFSGNDAIDDEEIEEILTLEEGEILSLATVKEQVSAIEALYAEEGFFLAKVSYELKPTGRLGVDRDVLITIDEGAEISVRRIRFVGNKNVDSRKLRKIMQTSETRIWSFITKGNRFNRASFEEDITRLQVVYYDEGYLAVKIGTPQVELTPDRKYIDVTVPVEEGPRFRIRAVGVRENDDTGKVIEPLGGKEAIRDKIKAERGEWFSRSKLGESLEEITRTYRDAGYARAEIIPETQLDFASREVDIVVAIRRGPLVRIERINIMGNTKTRDRVIRREFMIGEGELYSQTKIERSRARVEALGYFETVDMSEEDGSRNDRVVLNLEVTEKSTGTFQVGAGFSSIESILLTAQVEQQNLFGRGQTLGLQLQLSGIRRLFQIRFVEPYLFETRWSLALEAFRTTRQFVSFVRQSTGGNVTVGHPIVDDRLRLSLRYHIEKRNILAQTGGFLSSGRGQGFNIFQQVPLSNLYQDGFISSLRLGMSWDDRNNRIFPTKGIFLSGSTEVAESFLGSDNIFVRNTAVFRFYRPIWKGLVFKVNNEWGLITSRRDEGVPLDQRYFLGGIFSLRGYPLNGVGPRAGLTRTLDPNAPVDADGYPLGGNLQAFYNIELEFPIVESVGIKGVLFTDGGNAWNLESSLCGTPSTVVDDPAADPCRVQLWRIRTSYGFGLRWISPLGPLRFEWGFPIDRREFERPFRFEFTIGNFF